MTNKSISSFSGPAATLHTLLSRFFEGIRVHTHPYRMPRCLTMEFVP